MKKVILNVAAFAMLFAASCNKSEVQPQTGNNQAATTSNQKDGASTNNHTDIVTFPIDFTFTVTDCGGPGLPPPPGSDTEIHLTGTIRKTIHTTVNGNNFQSKIHTQPVGVIGIGYPSGAKYQGNGITETIITGSFVNGQKDTTFVNNFRLVGQGDALKYLQHDINHITVNANGETTVNFETETISCK